MKNLSLVIVLCLLAFPSYAQLPVWELKKDVDGIKVFTGRLNDSKLKAIRVECMVNASLGQLAALLLDSRAHVKWVYSTRVSQTVKTISDHHLLYYSEMDMPWPITDRDVVIDLKLTQDPDTRILTVKATAVQGNVEEKKDMVRVTKSNVTWTVTPLGNDQVKIEYVAFADPGGLVPSWAVNMFCTKGPFETFKSLREAVALPEYQHPHLAFLKE